MFQYFNMAIKKTSASFFSKMYWPFLPLLLVVQSCLALCAPGIEPRGSSWPRDWTWVSYIAGRLFICLSHQRGFANKSSLPLRLVSPLGYSTSELTSQIHCSVTLWLLSSPLQLLVISLFHSLPLFLFYRLQIFLYQ